MLHPLEELDQELEVFVVLERGNPVALLPFWVYLLSVASLEA
jgi:hypothetical protein